MTDDGNDLDDVVNAREELVREDSDQLLAAVERLRRIEAEKRRMPMSSPEFHRRAREVEDEARRVFRIAAREETHGERELELRIDDEQAGPGWPGGVSAGAKGAGNAAADSDGDGDENEGVEEAADDPDL